ncbi:MAG: LamB/YcsF family protein [Thermoprotei archaeon]|nr:MAG: LamB/YcsF family protein [Thermoprotei archaeon]
MARYVDLNTDSGESFGRWRLGNEEELFRYVTSANIACGFHAGDPNVMRRTVKLAREMGVAVGAHPGFPDLMGFGRRNMEVRREELVNYVIYQVGALEAFTRVEEVELQHVKPHGALYNMAWVRRDYAEAIVEAIKLLNPRLILVAPYGSEMHRVAESEGIRVAFEGFADRGYTPEGRLVPRGSPGAVITDPREAAERALRMVSEGRIKAVDGREIEIKVHTICIHGDSPNAVEMARAIRRRLEEAGITVAPMGAFLR